MLADEPIGLLYITSKIFVDLSITSLYFLSYKHVLSDA